MKEERTGDFGARLRAAREAAGLTQEALASRAGLTAKGIGAIERGERRHPYPHTVRSLADALGLAGAERDAFVSAAPRRVGMAFDAETEPEGRAFLSPTELVGRERDAAAARAFLEREGARLLTLTGPGGVGKTRLALEVARAAGELFPDGVQMVALAAVADPGLFLPTVAHALGLRQYGGRTARDLVHGHLRDKRSLLVLDNLEHLLEAAPEVADLLGSCPSLKVLATSRAPLRVRGEQEYPVEPLPVPDLSGVPAVGDVEGIPSVRLLVERAREVAPSFGLTRQNAAAVAAICRRLDGLPLALELVAAQLKVLPPTALLARLDEALPLLSGGPRDLPERQRTMRDTLAWSHDLLAPEEQELFARFSVFSGGFALAAAEAVGGGEALEGLGALLENSLIRTEPASMDGAEAEPRYGMLEPVRQYALERLEEGSEAEDTRRRHARHFLYLAERARPELEGAGQAAWMERLEGEHDNLRAALGFMLERGEAERAVRLGWSVRMFWAVRGHVDDGRRWMGRALAQEGGLAGSIRTRALCVIGLQLLAGGEAGRMPELLEEAVAEAREAGDEEALSNALGLLGYAATFLGDLHKAEEVLPEALAMARDRGDRWALANNLNGLGQARLSRGDFGGAMDPLREGEGLARGAGDAFTLASNLNMQATIAQFRGDDALTADLLRESVGLSAALRNMWSLGYGLVQLAGVAARQGQPVRAARLFGFAEAMSDSTSLTPSFSPAMRALYEQDLPNAVAQLDAEAFDAARAEGRAMSISEAVAEALAE
jgi:predicted ATPase/DNA-binding XRE family transcriptional regulator